MKKILGLTIAIVLIIGMVAGGTWAYFSDTEVSVDNVFTAGTIDISLNPSGGQDVVTLEGDFDLKPCQTGYIYACVNNDGTNPCEVWKHIANVDNREHGTPDAELAYYAAHPGSENWLISNWIHYDLFAYKSLGYSWYGEVATPEQEIISVVVEDGDCAVTWTVDFPIDDDTCNGLMAVGLVIALDGEGNGPAYQIHNNDGTDATFPWGTWLMSPWGPTISDGWFGWHSGSINTPVTALDWVEATGHRYKDGKPDDPTPNPEGVFTISIDKCRLVEDFHWFLYLAVGQFCNHAYSQHYVPAAASWGDPIVTMATPNYEYADIAELVQEIPETAGFFLSGESGVECNYIYLGVLEPGETMCVIQSYHLDATVDNWGQSDRVWFDMEFIAQQTEGDPAPPPPGPELPGYEK